MVMIQPPASNSLPKLPESSKLKKPKALTPSQVLFYSPDYKATYEEEIQEMNLNLLSLAETALSNYDFQTIDTINETSNTVIYNQDGSVAGFDYADFSSITNHQTGTSISSKTYSISDNTISEIYTALNEKINTVYSNFISKFGHTKNGQTVTTTSFPGYDKNGNPYYDLEINVTDSPGVIRYNIYMVEEGGK